MVWELKSASLSGRPIAQGTDQLDALRQGCGIGPLLDEVETASPERVGHPVEVVLGVAVERGREIVGCQLHRQPRTARVELTDRQIVIVEHHPHLALAQPLVQRGLVQGRPQGDGRESGGPGRLDQALEIGL